MRSLGRRGAGAGFAVEDEEAGGIVAGEFETIEEVADGLLFFHLFVEKPEQQIFGSVVADLFRHIELFVDLLGDLLLLLQGSREDIDGGLEFGQWFGDGLERDGDVAVGQVLIKLQRVDGLFETLVIHPAGETGLGGLFEPGGYRKILVTGRYLVVDLVVEEFG